MLAVLAVGGVAWQRSVVAVEAAQPAALGPYTGGAVVAADPQRRGPTTRIVLEIEGQRFESWIRGRARSGRAAGLRAGDVVAVSGQRERLDPDRIGRVRWQHVVGELDVAWLGDVRSGGALARSSNRVRAVIERGAAALPPEQAALLRGLVIGDDRDQPAAMVERFRASGLSHLTAVSGQNVALTVAAAGPVLRRMRPFARWVGTIGLIGWFVVLTRAEPSVLRAGVMAGLGVTAYALGRPREPPRLLALAVIGLLLADPLLVGSVGFWLSVGATGGVTVLGPRFAARLGRLGPLALPVGVTLGAQVGVALPSLLVFGRLSLAGTIANLLAVPVAAFLMLVGLPSCLLAGAVPWCATVVVAPVGWAVRWVDAVATVGAAVEPVPPWTWFGWAVLGVTVAVLMRPTGRERELPDSAP